MAFEIQLKRSGTPGQAPASLLPGEPAVDLASGALRFWLGDEAGTPTEIGQPVGYRVFSTVAKAETATIPDPGVAITGLQVQGWRAVGDCGPALLFRHVLDEPLHPGKLRTADGAWWELIRKHAQPEAFGAFGSALLDARDDTAALKDCLAYCVATGAALHLPAFNGYGLSESLVVPEGELAIHIVGGAAPFNLYALHPDARIIVERNTGGFRATEVKISGAHPLTEAWLGDHGFELKGYIDTNAANSPVLQDCIVRKTRKQNVLIGPDVTEFQIKGGRYTQAGLIDATLTGEARFVGGHFSNILVMGNGSVESCQVTGSTAYNIEVRTGPSVPEEVHCRCNNVRTQNGWWGHFFAADWVGAERDPSTIGRPAILHGKLGYMENPGTIQDSTTTGGSISQGDADDVVAVWADGDARISIDAPVKVLARRANSAFRATNGAQVDVDLRGTEYSSQQLGDTDTPRVVFDCPESENPGTIRVRSLPAWWESQDGSDIRIWSLQKATLLSRSPAGWPNRGVIFSDVRDARRVGMRKDPDIAVLSVSDERSPVVTTAAPHGLANGDYVDFGGFADGEGDDLADGVYRVAAATATTLELNTPYGGAVDRRGLGIVGASRMGRLALSAVNGIEALTWTAAPEEALGRWALKAVCRSDGNPTPSHVIFEVEAEPSWVEATMQAESEVRIQRNGTWPAAGLRPGIGVRDDSAVVTGSGDARVSDPNGVIFPSLQNGATFTVADPGEGGLSPWVYARSHVLINRTGPWGVMVRADAASALHDHIAYIVPPMVSACDGVVGMVEGDPAHASAAGGGALPSTINGGHFP